MCTGLPKGCKFSRASQIRVLFLSSLFEGDSGSQIAYFSHYFVFDSHSPLTISFLMCYKRIGSSFTVKIYFSMYCFISSSGRNSDKSKISSNKFLTLVCVSCSCVTGFVQQQVSVLAIQMESMKIQNISLESLYKYDFLSMTKVQKVCCQWQL